MLTRADDSALTNPEASHTECLDRDAGHTEVDDGISGQLSQNRAGRIEAPGPALPGFDQYWYEAGDIAHHVYHCGDRAAPPLLVMPEIAGFSPGLIQFVERLAEAQFQVHVPWLFGPFGRRRPFMNAMRLCVSREFANLRAGVSAPITTWLRALADHICSRNDHRQIGAIGMCLTGAFAIPLILQPGVVAAVAAQPAVPLSVRHLAFGIHSATSDALNIDAADIAAARLELAAGESHLLAFRCRADRLCPVDKVERLKREFPRGLEVVEYGSPDDRNSLGERPHALFTKEFRVAPAGHEDHFSRQAFRHLVAFFRQHLKS
jgi:dienelactone hydrolase